MKTARRMTEQHTAIAGGSNKYPEIEIAIEALKDLECDFAFFHEAALAIWGISYNSFLSTVDALVSKPIDGMEANNPYFAKKIGDSLNLRLWLDVETIGAPVQKHDMWNETYNCRVLDPELVLDLLPASPDYQELYEARARLAMVLYYDKMSESDLLEFGKYVRGI